MYRDAAAGRIPAGLPIFLTSASTKDSGNPHAAPPGHSTLEVMYIAPLGSVWPDTDAYSRAPEHLALKGRRTEHPTDRAATVIPDLRRHIV